MKALAAAYPGRIGAAEFRENSTADTGDWAVQVGETWFYYAQGRLLPENLRNRYAEYDPQPFYNYPAELPPWKDPTPEETERFKDSAQRRAANPPKRSQHFYDALWRASTREESYDRVKTIRFLGRSVMVHYSIMEELALVEERILNTAKTNAQVRQWMNRLDSLAGWNWRSIADTQSRSFHAYGTALDLLPTSYGGLQTYWLWTAQNFPAWWAVPYERRSSPPEAVIKAFEDYGFIWGGKWLFFDTMHFEYRPEILILNNLPVKTAN
ncbi:M15 family metallopeptidase [Treponema primitia]|uniref:M15 family metallopeptidase n=1 Tax=Treponema primitia TaxID=88058 RepID=UPI0039817337